MTRVNSGVVFEYECRDHYEARGFHVIRSAGSRGEADIIAFNEKEVHLIQCKKEKTKYPNYDEDIKQLREVTCPEYFKKIFIVKRNRKVYVYDCTIEDLKMQQFGVGDFKSGKVYKEDLTEQ